MTTHGHDTTGPCVICELTAIQRDEGAQLEDLLAMAFVAGELSSELRERRLRWAACDAHDELLQQHRHACAETAPREIQKIEAMSAAQEKLS